jgi:hypothetical protein
VAAHIVPELAAAELAAQHDARAAQSAVAVADIDAAPW